MQNKWKIRDQHVVRIVENLACVRVHIIEKMSQLWRKAIQTNVQILDLEILIWGDYIATEDSKNIEENTHVSQSNETNEKIEEEKLDRKKRIKIGRKDLNEKDEVSKEGKEKELKKEKWKFKKCPRALAGWLSCLKQHLVWKKNKKDCRFNLQLEHIWEATQSMFLSHISVYLCLSPFLSL